MSTFSYFLCFLTVVMYYLFFFKPKTAYVMRISDCSSDVCSSDLAVDHRRPCRAGRSGDPVRAPRGRRPQRRDARPARAGGRGSRRSGGDRKSHVEGKSVSVRVHVVGSRSIKKKIHKEYNMNANT